MAEQNRLPFEESRQDSILRLISRQTNFEAFAMIGPQTGGATSLWVKDPHGNLIVNDSLTPNTEPPSPSGYYGFYQISFPMSVNGTYQFGITNSWGVSSVFQTYDNVAHILRRRTRNTFS
jgi:hypothetical protein